MPVTTKAVLYEKKNRIAYITMNRPEVLNAQNDEWRMGMQQAFEDYRDDDSLLVAILTGAGGRAFSAGNDIKARYQNDVAGPSAQPRAGTQNVFELEVWKPIIAAIDGYALGGGLEIALKCDIRIATEKSMLGLTEPRVGVLAGYGLHNLSRMIPLGEALYIQLTGSQITAQEAYRIGIVHKVLPDREALMQEAERIAEEIKKCSPLALRAIKRIVYQGRNMPIEYSYKMGAPIREQITNLEDTKEGAKAFVEKRPPVWKMR